MIEKYTNKLLYNIILYRFINRISWISWCFPYRINSVYYYIPCNEHFWISFKTPTRGELIVRVTNQCRSSGRSHDTWAHLLSAYTDLDSSRTIYASRITSAVTEIYYDRCDRFTRVKIASTRYDAIADSIVANFFLHCNDRFMTVQHMQYCS